MTLALLLTALVAGLPARGQDAPAPRLETFVLEQVDPLEAGDPWTLLGGGAGAAPETVGFLSWRRSASEAGPMLEWDLRFSERETRLLEVERGEAGRAGLVYREMQPHAGRTLSAEWIEDGTALRLREWGSPQGVQLRLEDCAGGRFRLGLLEELRGSAAPPHSVRVFDPLSRRFEHLTIDVEHGAADGPWAGARLVRLSRADGSSAGTWLLRGEAVLGFQWQAGGLRARCIDAEVYSRRLAELAARRAAKDAGAPVGDAMDGD